MKPTTRRGLFAIGIVLPSLLFGQTVKGQESSCASSQSPSTISHATSGTGGHTGIFQEDAILSAPGDPTPTFLTPQDPADLDAASRQLNPDDASSLASMLLLLLGLADGDTAKPVEAGPDGGTQPQPWTNVDDPKAATKKQGKCAWQFKGLELIPFGKADDEKTKKRLDKIQEILDKFVDKAGDNFKDAFPQIKEAVDKIGPGAKEFDVLLIYICTVTEQGDGLPAVGTILDTKQKILHLGSAGNGDEDAIDFNALNGAQLLAQTLTGALKAKDADDKQKMMDEALKKIKDELLRSDECKKAISRNKPKKPCCGEGSDAKPKDDQKKDF